jgi:hypothetical protein
MDKLISNLEKYLNKYEISYTKLGCIGENDSLTGIKVKHVLNYDIQGNCYFDVETSVPGQNRFIFKIYSDGCYFERIYLSVLDFIKEREQVSIPVDDPKVIRELLNARLRFSGLASIQLYQRALQSEQERDFERYVFISDGNFFAPSSLSWFKVGELEFSSLHQYFTYCKAIALHLNEIAINIQSQWESIDKRNVEIILKNSPQQAWIGVGLKFIYRDIVSIYSQNSVYLKELNETRKGFFVFYDPNDFYLGTGFTERDSILIMGGRDIMFSGICSPL